MAALFSSRYPIEPLEKGGVIHENEEAITRKLAALIRRDEITLKDQEEKDRRVVGWEAEREHFAGKFYDI